MKPANFAGKGEDLKVFDLEDIDHEDERDDMGDELVFKPEIAFASIHRVAKRGYEEDTSISPVAQVRLRSPPFLD